MKVLTRDQLCAVLTACQDYQQRLRYVSKKDPALDAGIEKLRDNLRGRVEHEARKLRKKLAILDVAQKERM